MIHNIKKVILENKSQKYDSKPSSFKQEIIKNVSAGKKGINDALDTDILPSVEVEEIDVSGLNINGKYIDENGNSFDARYSYSGDGSYTVTYKDGIKDVKVYYDSDGNKIKSEVSYKGNKNEIIKEITDYMSDGSVEKSIYRDDILTEKTTIKSDGTEICVKYENSEIKSEKVINPDGTWKETIYDRKDDPKFTRIKVREKDADGNITTTILDRDNNKLTEEVQNPDGVIIKTIDYSTSDDYVEKNYDENGNPIDERVYKDGQLTQISLPDGRVFDYNENGDLTTIRIDKEGIIIQFQDNKVKVIVEGESSISLLYDEDGGIRGSISESLARKIGISSYEINPITGDCQIDTEKMSDGDRIALEKYLDSIYDYSGGYMKAK